MCPFSNKFKNELYFNTLKTYYCCPTSSEGGKNSKLNEI
jgi:hypothetical protein